jgi:flagellar basal body-associated protein FliL
MSRKNSKHKKNIKPDKGKKTSFLIIIAVLAGIAVVATSGAILQNRKDSAVNRGKSFSVNGEETGTVLDPSMFTGQAFEAYAAAKKYPEVMNQVFCYCFCDAEPFNHKTLLSCFTDKHGAG